MAPCRLEQSESEVDRKALGRSVGECDRHEHRPWAIHLHPTGPFQDAWKGVQGRSVSIKGHTHTEGNRPWSSCLTASPSSCTGCVDSGLCLQGLFLGLLSSHL